MKYLVLGSSGQIGSALVEYLQIRGETVFQFDIMHNPDEDLRKRGNKKLEKYIKDSDFVFFLAFDVGGSVYLKKYQNTYEFLSNNTRIMDTTFELLRIYDKPFIFASSQMSNMLFSPYGVLKAVGEYFTKTLNGLVIKLWNVYGIEKDLEKSHVITDFILKAKYHKVIDMITDGTEERQLLYSEDTCEALLTLVEHYNDISRDKELHIANHEWVRIIDVAKIIAALYPGTKIIPAKSTDSIQMNKRNEPDPYMLTLWEPKTKLDVGIKKISEFYNNNSTYKK